jgi:hypothetical protein
MIAIQNEYIRERALLREISPLIRHYLHAVPLHSGYPLFTNKRVMELVRMEDPISDLSQDEIHALLQFKLPWEDDYGHLYPAECLVRHILTEALPPRFNVEFDIYTSLEMDSICLSLKTNHLIGHNTYVVEIFLGLIEDISQLTMESFFSHANDVAYCMRDALLQYAQDIGQEHLPIEPSSHLQLRFDFDGDRIHAGHYDKGAAAIVSHDGRPL